MQDVGLYVVCKATN